MLYIILQINRTIVYDRHVTDIAHSRTNVSLRVGGGQLFLLYNFLRCDIQLAGISSRSLLLVITGSFFSILSRSFFRF